MLCKYSAVGGCPRPIFLCIELFFNHRHCILHAGVCRATAAISITHYQPSLFWTWLGHNPKFRRSCWSPPVVLAVRMANRSHLISRGSDIITSCIVPLFCLPSQRELYFQAAGASLFGTSAAQRWRHCPSQSFKMPFVVALKAGYDLICTF